MADKKKIPLIRPYITEEVKQEVNQVLDSGYLTEGPVTGALEDAKLKNSENGWNELALILLADHELPRLQISPEKLIFSDSLPSALQSAQDLLAAQEVKGVILAALHLEEILKGAGPHQYSTALDIDSTMNGLPLGQGVGALFFKDSLEAEQAEDRIYAVIGAMAFAPCSSGGGRSCQPDDQGCM